MKAPAQVKSPEQDPWVQQAKDLLISGKPKPAAPPKDRLLKQPYQAGRPATGTLGPLPGLAHASR